MITKITFVINMMMKTNYLCKLHTLIFSVYHCL